MLSENKADIIIIGGGIIGCAAAFEFSRAGCQVILLEKNQVASGISGDSGGLVRIFHTSNHAAKQAAIGFDYYQRFQQHVGYDCAFNQSGFVFISSDDISENVLQQINSYTIEEHFTKRIKPEQLPVELNIPHDLSIFYQPSAGYINTQLACKNWILAAQQCVKPLKLAENTQVERIVIKNNEVQGVKTTNGDYFAGHVIVTAGAGTKQLLTSFSPLAEKFSLRAFQYNIYHLPRRVVLPAIIHAEADLYIIPQQETIIAGFLSRDIHIQHEEPALSLSLTNAIHHAINKLLPELNWISEFITSKISIDCFTSDELGMVCAEPNIKNLHIATGWSGGGIKAAPAVASKLLAMHTS
jgi:glycine/D-amino acid oxidase-like deaminating enzyme